ncbi:hypothetical protein DMB42_02225 [Nonomuraea sp. WAC 01424]|nr:hypothetical protein DMB42_02225 [Nonomuraea sp. WAC 01424]
MNTAELLTFLDARLGEDERQAALFHESDCAALTPTRSAGCRCPVPQQILKDAAVRHRVVEDCRQQILQQQDPRSPDWPMPLLRALTTLGSLAHRLRTPSPLE